MKGLELSASCLGTKCYTNLATVTWTNCQAPKLDFQQLLMAREVATIPGPNHSVHSDAVWNVWDASDRPRMTRTATEGDFDGDDRKQEV